MAKTNKLLSWLMWAVGLITTLGIAGLFLNGTFMDTFLGFLPLVVHQIVGWVTIVSTVWFAISKVL